MKDVTVNINSQIAAHRRPISEVGSSLGCQFSKPEASVVLKDYEQKIQEAKENGGLGISLSRIPRKLRVVTVDVVSQKITTDIEGQVIILVNEGLDSEIRIPVNDQMTQAGVVTDDAILKALKGEDTNIHFSDIEKLAKTLNIMNQNEKARLEAVKADIELAIQRIDSAIAENNGKVERYKRERGASSTRTVVENGSTSVEINLGN